jgi:hypothetical protein
MEAENAGLEVKNLPTEIRLTARVVVKVPTFDEVREAYKLGRPVTVGYVMIGIGSGQVQSGVYYELTLRNIKGLEYSAARQSYQFEGSNTELYERSSYNQSSVSTERSDWRVEVVEDAGIPRASLLRL